MKPGDRFGALVVIETMTAAEAGHPRDGAWARVRCDCGRRFSVRARYLRWRVRQEQRASVSCGCKAPLKIRNMFLTMRALA